MSTRLPEPLPLYAWIPGGPHPHPRRDPAGAAFDKSEPAGHALTHLSAEENHAFRRGFELFDAGYYWEAHEHWEAVWQRTDRKSDESALLSGLIKLAAAGVKARQGQTAGTAKHLDGALRYFDSLPETIAGCRRDDLVAFTRRPIAGAKDLADRIDEKVVVVFSAPLTAQ